MNRGDVVLVRFPHPSGMRGKKRPAVVVQADSYSGILRTIVITEVTKNLTMKDDPACLFIDMGSPEGKLTGLLVDSVVSSLVLETVYSDTIAQVLGKLSPMMIQKLNDCLKAGLDCLNCKSARRVTSTDGSVPAGRGSWQKQENYFDFGDSWEGRPDGLGICPYFFPTCAYTYTQ